jgi:hypothetical protein
MLVFSAYGQTKKQDILKMLDLMDTRQEVFTQLDLLIPTFQELMPGIPQEFWKKFKASADIDSFIEMMASVYDKHFSHDDIKNLIKFYESPIGKKLVKATPTLTKDAYNAGQEWGEKLGEAVVKEITKQGMSK